MTTTVNNWDDLIDSRDVIEEIKELESVLEDYAADSDDEPQDAKQKLEALCSLQEEAKYSPDWEHGKTLIRDTYFPEYAQQLAEDIGAINPDANWPLNCIDWDQAARELQQDYFSANFDGVEYWIKV